MPRRPRAGARLEVRFTGYDEDGLARGAGPPDPGGRDPGWEIRAPERDPGWEIRAPGGARGERAVVEVEHASPHRRVAWGRILRLLEASPHRVRPLDGPEHRCGGCSWGHLEAAEQLRAKGERLAALAAAHPGAILADPRVRTSPRAEGYRDRAKYVLGRIGGRAVLGAFAPRTHRLLRTVGCPVTAPGVDRAAAALEAALESGPWTVYDEARGEGLLRYAGIREGRGGGLLVTLVAAAEPGEGEGSLAPLVAALREGVPGLIGVTLDVNPSRGNVIFSGQERVLWGSGSLEEAFGPARVALTGHGFGQVNREQAEALYGAAAEAALAPLPGGGLPRRIWELFCGAGALAQVIAHHGVGREGLRVRGVERDAAAVAQARASARQLGLGAVLGFEVGDASRAFDAFPPGDSNTERPQVVVLDPPRTGCRPLLLEALARAAVPRVVYVSCNPATLGRDLAALGAGGLAVRSLAGFDMMPMTPHLEVLAVAERR